MFFAVPVFMMRDSQGQLSHGSHQMFLHRLEAHMQFVRDLPARFVFKVAFDEDLAPQPGQAPEIKRLG